MKNRRNLLDYFSDNSADPEAIPFYPIVEIAGEHRVLVENHTGVIQYTTETVGIRVKYGRIQICGCGLMLKHMTREKLVVTGRIDQVQLIRGR